MRLASSLQGPGIGQKRAPAKDGFPVGHRQPAEAQSPHRTTNRPWAS